MKNIIRSIIAVVIIATSTISIPLVGAVTTTTSPTAAKQSIRCTISEGRLTTVISKAGVAQAAQSKIYTDVMAKVATFITNATTDGYDTTKLAAAQTSTQNAIDDYSAKATAYATSLTATKALTCGESDGDYAASLLKTRAALLAVRTASLSVRTAARSDILPAVKDYATWLSTHLTTQEKK